MPRRKARKQGSHLALPRLSDGRALKPPPLPPAPMQWEDVMPFGSRIYGASYKRPLRCTQGGSCRKNMFIRAVSNLCLLCTEKQTRLVVSHRGYERGGFHPISLRLQTGKSRKWRKRVGEGEGCNLRQHLVYLAAIASFGSCYFWMLEHLLRHRVCLRGAAGLCQAGFCCGDPSPAAGVFAQLCGLIPCSFEQAELRDCMLRTSPSAVLLQAMCSCIFISPAGFSFVQLNPASPACRAEGSSLGDEL